eukprot:XP_001697343.1 predicted protein [Chlamydomonas reinhardtii]
MHIQARGSVQLLVVVLLLLAHAHSSAADFAGYPYCTTSPTGTCQPCEVSSSGSSDVPCTTGDAFGDDPAICTAYFSPNYPNNFGGADKCATTGGGSSTAWRAEVFAADPAGGGAPDIRVGELQAWEDTSGYMVVGFMPQCPYVLDLSAGAGGPLTISITDTAISGGATQIRGTGAGQLAGAACQPYKRTVTLTAKLVTVAPAGTGVCGVLSSLAVLPVSISTGGSGGGTIDVNGGTSTTTPGGANGGTSTPTTGGANDLCPGELAALARSIRSELAARLGLNDSQPAAAAAGRSTAIGRQTSIQEVVAALSAAPQNATAYTGAASSWVVCSPPPSADSIRAVAGVAVTYAVPLTAEGAAAYAAQCGGDTSSGTTSSSTTSSSTAAAVTPLQLSSSLTCALVPVAGGPTVPSDRDLMAAPPGVGGNTYAGGPPPAGDAGSGGGRSGIDRSLAVILAGMAVGGAILITCSVTALVLVLRRRERRLEEEARRKRLREEGGEAAAAAAAAAAGGGRGLQAGRTGVSRSGAAGKSVSLSGVVLQPAEPSIHAAALDAALAALVGGGRGLQWPGGPDGPASAAAVLVSSSNQQQPQPPAQPSPPPRRSPNPFHLASQGPRLSGDGRSSLVNGGGHAQLASPSFGAGPGLPPGVGANGGARSAAHLPWGANGPQQPQPQATAAVGAVAPGSAARAVPGSADVAAGTRRTKRVTLAPAADPPAGGSAGTHGGSLPRRLHSHSGLVWRPFYYFPAFSR